MFDDNEPQDIFEDSNQDKTESSTKPSIPAQQMSDKSQAGNSGFSTASDPIIPGKIPPASLTPDVAQEISSARKFKVLALIIVFVVVALVITLAVIWYLRNSSNTTLSEEQNNGNDLTEQTNNNAAINGEPVLNGVGAVDEQDETIMDSNNDGLTDTEEMELGTDIAVSDTDQDGLSDYEEVKIWKTDPLNPDTDGDTYLDGTEVDSGYDPNQAGGILLNLPQNLPK